MAERLSARRASRQRALVQQRTMREADRTLVVKELIGRDASTSPFFGMGYPTVDRYRTDYLFWDKLRNCKAEGYELAGLFCRPITQILAAYIFGKAPTYSLTETPEDEDDPIAYTNGLLKKFVTRYQSVLLTLIEDLHGLGDQFVIVNPDGSLAVPSPDAVQIEYERWNPRKMEKVIITTRDRGVTITETYSADFREIRTREGAVERVERYDNLIGRLPVVHFANNRRANELYGRPEYEAMLPLFSWYDDLLIKGLTGSRVLGNPIPVMEGMENLQETIQANQGPDEMFTGVDGSIDTRETVNFDTNGIIFVGKGGKFEFKGPARGFTEDIRAMLRAMFELIIDHVRIPELIYGAALGGNRASAETQLAPFVRFIDAKRAQIDGRGKDTDLEAEAEGGMYELVDLFLRTKRLTDPRVVVDDVKASWPLIDLADENVKLQKIIYAHGTGMVDRTEGLDLLDLVTNPPLSVAKAQEEKEHDQMMQEDYMTSLNRAAKQDMSVDTGAMLKKSAPPDPDGGRNVPFGDGFVGESKGNAA